MGAGNIHVGNVTEFNAPRLRPLDEVARGPLTVGCEEYASLAPFYTSEPGLVLTPEGRRRHWHAEQARMLRWDRFDPVQVPGPPGATFDTIRRDPQLRAIVAEAMADGAQLVPWGETADYRAFVAALPRARAVRSGDAWVPAHVDSKTNSAEIFAAAHRAMGSPAAIRLLSQDVCRSRHELEVALTQLLARDGVAVLKIPHEAGGHGTVFVDRAQLEHPPERRRILDAWGDTDVVVQERQTRARHGWADLTADCEIGPDGDVAPRGVCAMIVIGTHYRGAVTADRSIVPAPQVTAAAAFGRHVAEASADLGYRGWLDVDFVVGPDGTLAPVEINARRTGPTVVSTVRERLRTLRPDVPVAVACHDSVSLPAGLDSDAAFAHFTTARARAALDDDAVPTLTAAVDATEPYLGVAIGAASGAAAIECLVRLAGQLGEPAARQPSTA